MLRGRELVSEASSPGWFRSGCTLGAGRNACWSEWAAADGEIDKEAHGRRACGAESRKHSIRSRNALGELQLLAVIQTWLLAKSFAGA